MPVDPTVAVIMRPSCRTPAASGGTCSSPARWTTGFHDAADGWAAASACGRLATATRCGRRTAPHTRSHSRLQRPAQPAYAAAMPVGCLHHPERHGRLVHMHRRSDRRARTPAPPPRSPSRRARGTSRAHSEHGLVSGLKPGAILAAATSFCRQREPPPNDYRPSSTAHQAIPSPARRLAGPDSL
jgi:hypothetical protein